MTEHHEGKCIATPNGIITLSATQREIVVNGITYYLCMHRYLGPMRLTKYGLDHKRPFPRHVWGAVQKWIDGGKRMNGDVCVWEDVHPLQALADAQVPPVPEFDAIAAEHFDELIGG